MNATSMLRRQHRRIETILQALDGACADPTSRDALLAELVDELMAHLVAEGHVFYPRVSHIVPASYLTALRETHDAAKDALLYLATLEHGSARFEAKLHELRAIIARHVSLGEEPVLVAVDRLVPNAQLDALGAEMRDYACSVAPPPDRRRPSTRRVPVARKAREEGAAH
jgi:hypothetical protein